MNPLDIANNALSMLGEPPIGSFDPNGNGAQRMCCLHYHPIRREVLCVAAPAFAQRDATITSPQDEHNGYMLPHEMPRDCMRVLKVEPSAAWTLRNRCVMSPHKEISIRYIADCEDSEKFTPGFLDIFTTRLATKLCLPLVGSTDLRAELMQRYSDKLAALEITAEHVS